MTFVIPMSLTFTFGMARQEAIILNNRFLSAGSHNCHVHDGKVCLEVVPELEPLVHHPVD